MDVSEKTIELEVEESNTVLVKVIQIIKRRRIYIKSFIAEPKDNETGIIKINVHADDEQCRLMKPQFERIIEVIQATTV